MILNYVENFGDILKKSYLILLTPTCHQILYFHYLPQVKLGKKNGLNIFPKYFIDSTFRLLKNVLRSFLYNILQQFFCFLCFFNDPGDLVLKYLVCIFDFLFLRRIFNSSSLVYCDLKYPKNVFKRQIIIYTFIFEF